MNFFTHFKHSRPTPNSSCCNNNPTKLNSILYRILNKQMFNKWNRSTKTTEWKGEKIAPKWNDIFQPRKKSYVKWFFDRHSWHIRIFPFPFNHFFIFFFFFDGFDFYQSQANDFETYTKTDPSNNNSSVCNLIEFCVGIGAFVAFNKFCSFDNFTLFPCTEWYFPLESGSRGRITQNVYKKFIVKLKLYGVEHQIINTSSRNIPTLNITTSSLMSLESTKLHLLETESKWDGVL